MPDDAEAVRRLGEFAAQAEKWAAAAKAYQRLVEITEGQEQVDAAVRLAEACENAGSPLEARPALEQVYARSPTEVVRTRLRRMYEAAGAYEQLATLVMAEAEEATDPATKVERYIDAGDLSLRIQGGEQTAIAAYRTALELAPEDHRVIVKLAELLGNVGEIEQAATLLDSAINSHKQKRSPELSELQHAMARIGRLAEDFEAVFAWLEAAIQTDRQNGAAAAELAVLAMDRGDFETATKALQAITLLKTPGPMGRAEAYLRQGMIAEQRGDRRKAVFLVKRAISTDPEYQDAKTFLEQIEK
jgi:tetratricopeptide (TPR) repeat protein